MHVCGIVLMIAVLTQLLQCSTAYQTRPPLPANTDHDEDRPGLAKMLMVLQNHKALKCVGTKHETVQQKMLINSWTMWYLFFKNKDSGSHWASHCKDNPPPKDSPLPQSQELYDNIWPNIFEPKSENQQDVKTNWEKEGKCAEKYYKLQYENGCTSGKTGEHDPAHCYYKQAQQLYERGINFRPVPAHIIQNTTIDIDTTVSSYLNEVLRKMFNSEDSSENIIECLQLSTVQKYFSEYILKKVNPYLGCQYRNGDTSTCYLTRVGLCFTCNVKNRSSDKPGYCTPRLSDGAYPPGVLATCPMGDILDMPWNEGLDEEFQDMPCLDNKKCHYVRYTPPEETDNCD